MGAISSCTSWTACLQTQLDTERPLPHARYSQAQASNVSVSHNELLNPSEKDSGEEPELSESVSLSESLRSSLEASLRDSPATSLPQHSRTSTDPEERIYFALLS